MINIITTITALVGCLLGIYNFVENLLERIKSKQTDVEFYPHGGSISCKIKSSNELIEYDYDAAEAQFCFSIKNNSSHPIFFDKCDFSNYKIRKYIFGKVKIDISNAYYKYEDGKEIPIICPFKIDAHDVCVIIYKGNEKNEYKNKIEIKTSYEKINFYYIIDNVNYCEEMYANVTYYKDRLNYR